MIFLSLSELESLLTALLEHAQRYRANKDLLATVEERWLKFQELAFAFGVELKPAEGVDFYAGGPLPDNTDFMKKVDRMLATIRKLKEIYGDIKVFVDIDLNIKKVSIKI